MERGKRARGVRRVRVVLVGDRGSGKTCLLHRHVHASFPATPHLPAPLFDVAGRRLTSDGVQVDVVLRDTADGVDALRKRALAYAEADVILVCFSVDNPDGLERVDSAWVPEVREHCGKTPILLVGTKTDLRHEPSLQTSVAFIKQGPVKVTDAKAVAVKVGAVGYVECSSKYDDAVTRVLQEAVAAALQTRAFKNRRTRLMQKLKRVWTT